jgi:hypothetical protein
VTAGTDATPWRRASSPARARRHGIRQGRGAVTLLHALALLAAALLLLYWCSGPSPLAQPPGVLAAQAPRQLALDSSVAAFERAGYTLVPFARFDLRARVLARADYRFDRGAALVPVDLALGWGRMSDSRVLEQVEISQSGRWYRWSVEAYPIPHEEIVASSANMHLIPADDAVAATLDAIRVGQIVSLTGYLVDAHHAGNGHRWNSSRSRTDSGDGACELIWVETLQG